MRGFVISGLKTFKNKLVVVKRDAIMFNIFFDIFIFFVHVPTAARAVVGFYFELIN